MKRSIIIGIVAALLLGTLVIWMLNTGRSISGTFFGIMGIQLVVLVFAIFVIYKRWTAAKNKLPAEDEMSKGILRRGAATSYYVSIYMWLAFMYFEERIDMERSTLIGAGILGMAIIYGLSWVYHTYIRRPHD